MPSPTPESDDPANTPARAWLAAALDPQISGELELVYEHIARAVDTRKPVCNSSGRCCNFDAWGHRLYVTGLEAAYLFTRLPQLRDKPLTTADITTARTAGGCPFQLALLCTVHPIRPLGCRTYYCDESSQQWQHDLTEEQLREVRAIHNRHDLDYQYGEWRDMLEQLLGTQEP
ncbi:MAG: hypothetical protein Q9O74_04550 [Planctomycetota bacterium]|nr:hypothetical protein [Planctomycetota bacterium]